jgi:hypothetical protein
LGQPHAFTQAGDDKQGPHKNGSGRDRGVERGAVAPLCGNGTSSDATGQAFLSMKGVPGPVTTSGGYCESAGPRKPGHGRDGL